jgi:two-component system invasion response regulator UvrY
MAMEHAAPRPRAPVSPGDGPIAVLIVEDHPALSIAIRALLESHHDEVIVLDDVHTADEALTHPLLDAADAVLIDVGLPDMSGLRATEQLLAGHPGLRVVVMSGSGYDRTRQDSLDCGASAYVEKGCLTDELVHTLVDVCRA